MCNIFYTFAKRNKKRILKFNNLIKFYYEKLFYFIRAS